MRIPPVVTYLALRTGLLLAFAAALYALGMRGPLLLAVALLVSSVVAIPLLSRQRDAVSARVASRVERTRERLAEAERSEDDDPR